MTLQQAPCEDCGHPLGDHHHDGCQACRHCLPPQVGRNHSDHLYETCGCTAVLQSPRRPGWPMFAAGHLPTL